VSNGNAPAFFLSYARAPIADANDFVKQFFRDLRGDISHLLALKPGDLSGFMDRNLEAGTQWEPELLKMAGTCRVFVALLSEPYLFRSKWCAMEWDLFSKRTVAQRKAAVGGSDFSRAVLPVIWAPITSPIPFRVNRVQWFVPDLPEPMTNLYHNDGVLGAMKIDQGAYRAITWKLALEIQKAIATYEVTPIHLLNSDGLRRSFRGGGL